MSASSAHIQVVSPLLVVDSWPVMEWFKNRQPMANQFRTILEMARAGHPKLLLSSINLGEIYYNCWREWGEVRADEAIDLIGSLPIQVLHPTEVDVLSAARLKGQYPVSYADCFAAVLTLKHGGSVLTGDPDFLILRQNGVVRVDWIGA
jgi:ribonuclease VapC